MVDREVFFSVLKNVTIFSGIKDEELHDLYDRCEIIEYGAGEEVIKQGTAATEIFIILKGKIKIVLSLDNDPLEIVELGPGNCIGEASVIGIQAHSASAVAIEDSSLLVLSRKILMELQKSNKDLFSLLILNLAREIARRLNYTDEILLHYSRKKNNFNK